MCVLHTYGVCASVCSTSNTTSHYNPKYCNLNCESIGYPFQIILYFISPCFLLLPSNKSLYIFNWFCAIEQHRFFFFRLCYCRCWLCVPVAGCSQSQFCTAIFLATIYKLNSILHYRLLHGWAPRRSFCVCALNQYMDFMPLSFTEADFKVSNNPLEKWKMRTWHEYIRQYRIALNWVSINGVYAQHTNKWED